MNAEPSTPVFQRQQHSRLPIAQRSLDFNEMNTPTTTPTNLHSTPTAPGTLRFDRGGGGGGDDTDSSGASPFVPKIRAAPLARTDKRQRVAPTSPLHSTSSSSSSSALMS